jgi:hypothetical protein
MPEALVPRLDPDPERHRQHELAAGPPAWVGTGTGRYWNAHQNVVATTPKREERYGSLSDPANDGSLDRSGGAGR